MQTIQGASQEATSLHPPPADAFIPWGDAGQFVQQFHVNPQLQHDPEIRALHHSLTANASVCSYCGVGCPYAKVTDAKGRPKLVPLSPLGLCVKGETSLLTGGDGVRDEKLHRRGRSSDRIRTPMIRNHDGSWKAVSWQEALDRAAWLFLHVREWVGPDGVALYGNGQQTVEAIWMASLYKLVFQIPTVGANSEHCLASAGAGHELNFGNEASFTWNQFEELALADVILLHGTNPIITFPQAYAKLKQNRNAVKVVIDPVESDTALDLRQDDPRNLHIRFEQGGDVLFNLAVARTILENGWEDRDFLGVAVDAASLASFRDLVFEDRCRPEAVAEQIALAEDDPTQLAQTIRRYAELIARPRENGERPRCAFVSSMGINQSTGSYGFSTNLNLLLLTGNVGRRGAGSLRIAGQSNATSELMLGFNARRLVFNLRPDNPAHRQELAEILDLPLHNIPDRAGVPVARMAEDDHLYCFIFMGTHFTRNMPRLGDWLKRLGRSFNIVIDSFLPEGALDYADVILPALTYTERTGVIQRGDRTLQLQQPLTQPPPMAWHDEQILARLALAIATRLEDADTAALNDLDPVVVARTFRRYLDEEGTVDTAGVFDHVVETSRRLDVYNRLEDADGRPISHAMLRERAGLGVQWQGDGRYGQAGTQGQVFPGLRRSEQRQARLVRPPERFLERLVARGDEALRSLITGRGRPGRNYKRYVARYNSGIKTLPITPNDDDQTYWIEVHPTYAAQRGWQAGDPVRITSHHGTVIGMVSLNEHVPQAFPFLDFVPGEANRLTSYLDADQFTAQSLIKRTPIRMVSLSALERRLWDGPDPAALDEVVNRIHAHYRHVYPTDADAEAFARGDAGARDWLPVQSLRTPSAEEEGIALAVGAFSTFLQRYVDSDDYRAEAGRMLHSLIGDQRDRFLTVLLPLLTKLDYHSLLLPILTDVVGDLVLASPDGSVVRANLHEAHQSAVIEIKEEVVAVQLFLAMKHGLELLFGKDRPVPREDVAVISGIRIPCAADIPSYFMGISPSDLKTNRLVHCAQIGPYAIAVVDRRTNRAVKIDTVTGILPRDTELLTLRRSVIMNKRDGDRAAHARFFGRLSELVVSFVRTGTGNFRVTGPTDFPWQEFSTKMSFVPGQSQAFRQFVLGINPTPGLVDGLMDLAILHPQRDAALAEDLRSGRLEAASVQLDLSGERANGGGRTYVDLINDALLSTEEKVKLVIEGYIQPVLDNDGGAVDYLGFDPARGEVSVRFLGSCANCPASILSVETLVKPPLLNIPGVHRVTHRTRLRKDDEKRVETVRQSRLAIALE